MAGSSFASRSYRDLAVILRTQKLGESDRIITLLTARHGLIRAVAKGVRRTQSKFGATVEPFMVADVQLVHGRSLDIITQAQGRGAYGPMIAADYDKYTAGCAIVEVAERLTDSGAAEEATQFQLLRGALSALARGLHPPDVVMCSYLLRALSAAGWQVTWTVCVGCGAPGPHTGFHPGSGGPVCADCRPPGTRTVHTGTMVLLDALQHGRWDDTAQASPDLHHEALAVTTEYVHHHMERRISSLAGLAQ